MLQLLPLFLGPLPTELLLSPSSPMEDIVEFFNLLIVISVNTAPLEH